MERDDTWVGTDAAAKAGPGQKTGVEHGMKRTGCGCFGISIQAGVGRVQNEKGDVAALTKRGPIYDGADRAKIKSEGACGGRAAGQAGGAARPHHAPPAQRQPRGRHDTAKTAPAGAGADAQRDTHFTVRCSGQGTGISGEAQRVRQHGACCPAAMGSLCATSALGKRVQGAQAADRHEGPTAAARTGR